MAGWCVLAGELSEPAAGTATGRRVREPPAGRAAPRELRKAGDVHHLSDTECNLHVTTC